MSSSQVVNTAGPLFIALLFSSFALGVLTVQVCIYHLAFPNDPIRLKTVVGSVYILEIAQTALISYSLYQQFVYGFLNVNSLDEISCNWLAVPILGGIVTFIVQNFYVHRILVFGRFLRTNRASVISIAVLIVIISTVQLITGVIVGIQLQRFVLYSRIVIDQIERSAGVFYGTGTTSDVAIAVCMTIILLRSSSQTLPRTRTIVRRLVRLTIEAGSLTAAMSVITILLVVVPMYETYYQPSAAALSKLYSNAMMAVLLNRIELSNWDVNGTSAGESHSSTLRFSNSRGEASTGWTFEDGHSQMIGNVIVQHDTV